MSATNIATEIQRINTAVGVIRAAMADLGISVSNSDTIDILATKLANADIKGGDMNYYGECTTASSTDAKTVTITGFELTTGALLAIKFTHAVEAGATLSVSDGTTSSTAKALYFRGYPIVDGIINNGDIATFLYDGTNFKLISVDSPWKSRIEITGDPEAVVTVTNTTYGISDDVTLDTDGKATYVAKRPGTYVISVPEE